MSYEMGAMRVSDEGLVMRDEGVGLKGSGEWG